MREESVQVSDSLSCTAPRPCVLVVDDDKASRRLLALALEQAGFEARQAVDGNDALASVAERIPDVLLLDLQMPELNGAETCQILREHEDPAINELPVIMLTAQDDEAAEVRCLESGANDFLAKPVGRAALTARIQTQLRLRTLALELRARNEELERWRTNQLADLEAARLTQTVIVPARTPQVSGWRLESFFEPLIQVGGAIYGWRALSGGRQLLWIADATGHGAAAALVTTTVAYLFQQATLFADEPHQILHAVNTEYFGVFRGKSFVTAMCAVLAPDGSVSYSSAGHPPMLVARKSGKIENFPAGATMIGLTPDLNTISTLIRLQAGERLLAFTDGLYSLRLHSGERMTCEAVNKALSAADRTGVLIDSIFNHLKNLADDQPFDDLSLIHI